MRRPRASSLLEVFFEYVVAALAEGLVAAAGWVLRKLHKRWKKKHEKVDEETE